MTSFRTASTTTETSGSVLFQTAYTDEAGNITSFTAGDVRVDKYWKSSTAEVLYKKIEMPLMFMVGYDRSYKFDGNTFTEVSHANFDTAYKAAVMFKGKYYVIASTYNLYVSTDLTSWTYTGESLSTLATDGNYLVGTMPSGAAMRIYNGTSWSNKNTWDLAPEKLNSVRFVNNKWVAVGYWDDTGNSGYKKPFTSYSNDLVTWTDTQHTGGDGDTGILDIAWNGTNYYNYCYVGNNYTDLNVYVNSDPGFSAQFPDYYTGASGNMDINRGSTAKFVVTPNNRLLAPYNGYNFLVNGGNPDGAVWECYPPAQDKNGIAYMIDYDNSGNYDIYKVDSNVVGVRTMITTLATAAYICGGAR